MLVRQDGKIMELSHEYELWELCPLHFAVLAHGSVRGEEGMEI
jgi:hypothetical protein